LGELRTALDDGPRCQHCFVGSGEIVDPEWGHVLAAADAGISTIGFVLCKRAQCFVSWQQTRVDLDERIRELDELVRQPDVALVSIASACRTALIDFSAACCAAYAAHSK
jgi:hypothetical protein